MPYSSKQVISIINEVKRNKGELPWIELKINNKDPNEIGEYISALANTAALFDRERSYMIWGVDDKTYEIVGTDFDPENSKIGNQDLSLWLSVQLNPDIQFYFHKVIIDDISLVLLEIYRANSVPIKFKSEDYIRIASNKKKLKDYPDTERELWSVFSNIYFENLIAMENVSGDFVLRELDYPSYFELLDMDLPEDKSKILEYLQQDGMINISDMGSYNITNLGAILFAKRLSDFPSLSRKAIRIVKYEGDSRLASASKENVIDKGYASSFQNAVEYVNNLLPNNETLGAALRKVVPMYPELAIRELIANAIIHQNFYMRGTSVMVEIFTDRIEITNPGNPLIDKMRFIDHPPISRNEKLASFMRRVGICEERGSGYDKIVSVVEECFLPAPDIQIHDNFTTVILFAHLDFNQMSKEDRIRTCYTHACVKKINREYMTNSSLRARFNLPPSSISVISRLLAEVCDLGLIKLSDRSIADKNRKYSPFWA